MSMSRNELKNALIELFKKLQGQRGGNKLLPDMNLAMYLGEIGTLADKLIELNLNTPEYLDKNKERLTCALVFLCFDKRPQNPSRINKLLDILLLPHNELQKKYKPAEQKELQKELMQVLFTNKELLKKFLKQLAQLGVIKFEKSLEDTVERIAEASKKEEENEENILSMLFTNIGLYGFDPTGRINFNTVAANRIITDAIGVTLQNVLPEEDHKNILTESAPGVRASLKSPYEIPNPRKTPTLKPPGAKDEPH